MISSKFYSILHLSLTSSSEHSETAMDVIMLPLSCPSNFLIISPVLISHNVALLPNVEVTRVFPSEPKASEVIAESSLNSLYILSLNILNRITRPFASPLITYFLCNMLIAVIGDPSCYLKVLSTLELLSITSSGDHKCIWPLYVAVTINSPFVVTVFT